MEPRDLLWHCSPTSQVILTGVCHGSDRRFVSFKIKDQHTSITYTLDILQVCRRTVIAVITASHKAAFLWCVSNVWSSFWAVLFFRLWTTTHHSLIFLPADLFGNFTEDLVKKPSLDSVSSTLLHPLHMTCEGPGEGDSEALHCGSVMWIMETCAWAEQIFTVWEKNSSWLHILFILLKMSLFSFKWGVSAFPYWKQLFWVIAQHVHYCMCRICSYSGGCFCLTWAEFQIDTISTRHTSHRRNRAALWEQQTFL